MKFEMVMKLIVGINVIVATLASLNVTIDELKPIVGQFVTITCTIPGFGSSKTFASFRVGNMTWGSCLPHAVGSCLPVISAEFSTNATVISVRKKFESTDEGDILTCEHDDDTGFLILPHAANTTTTTATSPSPPLHQNVPLLIVGLVVVVILIDFAL